MKKIIDNKNNLINYNFQLSFFQVKCILIFLQNLNCGYHFFKIFTLIIPIFSKFNYYKNNEKV